MQKVCLTLQYDGTRYHGWQVQPNSITVQETLQNAIQAVIGIRASVTGCSRTDAGVHANRFYCTTSCPQNISCEQYIKALNANLPKDIAVLACVCVPREFHPRYSVVGKRYQYRFWNGGVRNPFWEPYALHIRSKLDENSMTKTAHLFEGTHDFSAFCSAGSEVEDKTRTIYRAFVTREGDLLSFTVEGNGFLYNMVRIMAGTLLDVENGKISHADIQKALQTGERDLAGATAPAHGLILDDVWY